MIRADFHHLLTEKSNPRPVVEEILWQRYGSAHTPATNSGVPRFTVCQDGIKFVLNIVRRYDPLCCDFDDWGFLQTYDLNVVPVELLVVAGVTNWSTGKHLGRNELMCLFRVLDFGKDFWLDELGGSVVCSFIGRDVPEIFKHEPESSPSLPCSFVDLVSLLFADTERLPVRFLGPKSKEAVVFGIFPNLGVVLIDGTAILLHNRTLATWNAELRVLLEVQKLRHIFRYRGDDLDSSGAIVDHSHAPFTEINTFGPSFGVVHITGETIDSFKVGEVLPREQAQSRH
jgi:hypothetical protein